VYYKGETVEQLPSHIRSGKEPDQLKSGKEYFVVLSRSRFFF